MPQLYNAYELPTEVDLTQGFGGLFNYLNTNTSSWLSILLLLAIYVIFASGYYYAKKDIAGGFAIGGFAIFVIGTLLWVAQYINLLIYVPVVIISIISFASLWLNRHEL